MREFSDRRYVLRRNWVFVLGLFLSFYFSYHLLQGDRSYVRLIGLHQAIARETADYDRLKMEEDALQQKVQMLRPGSINPDYLEERARAMLGYRAAEETDVILGQKSRFKTP